MSRSYPEDDPRPARRGEGREMKRYVLSHKHNGTSENGDTYPVIGMHESLDGDYFLASDVVALVEELRIEYTAIARATGYANPMVTVSAAGSITALTNLLKGLSLAPHGDDEGDA